MQPSDSIIQCVFYGDLLPWEKQAITPVINVLSRHVPLHVLEVEKGQPLSRKQLQPSVQWLFARDWQRAVAELRLDKARGEVFASVFGLSQKGGSLFTVLWKQFFSGLPKNLKLITHSKINHRFFSEIAKLDKAKLFFLPLCFGEATTPEKPMARKGEDGFVIGTFGAFEPESNLNYVLNVAHSVCHQKKFVQFRIMGSGKLAPHIQRMIRELNLEKNVTVVDTSAGEEIGSLDLLLYTPTRNNHFLPLHYAATAKVPVLASQCFGIEDYITEAHSGFIVPINETAPMVEHILNLFGDSTLRKNIAKNFRAHMEECFSVEKLLSAYAEVLSNGRGAFAKSVHQAA